MNKKIFLLLLIVLLFTGCTKHNSDSDVQKYLMEQYNSEFDLLSRDEVKVKKPKGCSGASTITHKIWHVKSKKDGKTYKVEEYYEMCAFTCCYRLLSEEE